MPWNYLRLIPTNPNFIPEEPAQNQARDLFASFVPQAYKVSSQIYEDITFVDAGSNYERIMCPSCGTTLNHNWWINEMDRAYNKTKFTDLTISTPCCDILCSLNDLRYEWPMGFARFIIEAINPYADIEESQIHILEQILQCKLRKIWASL